MATNKVKVDITADGSGFHRTLAGMGSALTGLKSKLAAAFSVGTIGYVSKQILDFGDSIQKMADDFDISTDAAQRFEWASRNANISVGTLEKGMIGLDTAMRKALGGDTKSKNILAQLGISGDDLEKLKKDEALLRILQTAKDKGYAANKTVGLLGEIGIQPRIAQRIVSRSEDLLNKNIPIVSENTIKKLDALGDAFGNVKNIILQALMPALLSFAKAVTEFARKYLFQSDLDETFRNAAKAEAVARGEYKGDTARVAALSKAGVSPSAIAAFWTGNAEGMRKIIEKVDKEVYGEAGVKAGKAAVANYSANQSVIGRIVTILRDLETKLQPQPGDPDFIGPVQPTPEVPYVREALRKKGKAPTYTDLGEMGGGGEFLKIGGGLGINVQYRMERIAIQTRDYMARVATATEEMNDKMDNGTGQEWGGEPT